MFVIKKVPNKRFAWMTILSILFTHAVLAAPCSSFPPSSNLPLQVGAALTLSAVGITGQNKTDQMGRLGIGASNISIAFNMDNRTTSLVFTTTNPARQVKISIYKGSNPPISHVYPVSLNLLTLVNELTDGANQLIIEGLPPTNDTYLLLACSD